MTVWIHAVVQSFISKALFFSAGKRKFWQISSRFLKSASGKRSPKNPAGLLSWRIYIFLQDFTKDVLFLFSPQGLLSSFPTRCQRILISLEGHMSCNVIQLFILDGNQKKGLRMTRVARLSSLLQDLYELSIVSPRWGNLHIQACSYETTGMCSGLSVATAQKRVKKRICWTHRGTIAQNPASLRLEHLSWVRVKQAALSREPGVKPSHRFKVCLECPLCNINHKSNINYVKKRWWCFGTPGYVGLWRRSAYEERPVVLVTRT